MIKKIFVKNNSKKIIIILFILIILGGYWLYKDFIDYKPQESVCYDVIKIEALPKVKGYPTYSFTYRNDYGDKIKIDQFINIPSSLNIVRLSTSDINYLKIEPNGRKILFLTHETLKEERG